MTPTELKRLRLAAGLSQPELGRRIAEDLSRVTGDHYPVIHYQNISRWERGGRNISPLYRLSIERVCAAPGDNPERTTAICGLTHILTKPLSLLSKPTKAVAVELARKHKITGVDLVGSFYALAKGG